MDLATSERFTKLWVHAQGTVATFISTMMPEVHRAEDILQDVAVAALRKFDRFDETRSFQAWVGPIIGRSGRLVMRR